MTRLFNVTDALDSLGIKEWSLSGLPTNEEEFLTYFSKVVDVDSNNHAIFSKDPQTFGVTWSQIQTEIQRLQTEYTNNNYQRNRKTEYPSIEEQLDMQYWDKINGTNNWEQTIQAVKQKYPK
jgi:hypothetical protein